MAARSKVAKAGTAAAAAKAAPYVKRLAEDEELRASIVQAVTSGRDAYGRLNSGRNPARQLLDDKKLHRSLKDASDQLRFAGESLHEPEKYPRKRRFGFGKLILVALVGGIVALAVSEDLRNKVLDLMFGAEEEFEYTSTTSPPAPSATASEPAASPS